MAENSLELQVGVVSVRFASLNLHFSWLHLGDPLKFKVNHLKIGTEGLYIYALFSHVYFCFSWRPHS